MKKSKIFVIFIYVLLGIILCAGNLYASIVYITVLPFHLWMVSFFYSRKRFLLTLFSIVILVAIGVNSIFFFLADNMDDFVGMNTFGSYNKVDVFFHAYIQLFFFCLTIILLSLFFKQRTSTNIIKESFSMIRSYFGEGSMFNKTTNTATFLLIVLVPLMCYMTLWMYDHNVGILGLKQTVLPYHMTGVLFYIRRFLFPIVLLYLFIKSPHKLISFILLSVYAVIAATTGSSKSLGLLITIPLILLGYGYKNRLLFFSSILLSIGIYIFVSASRNFMYLSDTPLYTITEVFSLSWVAFTESDWNALTDFFVSFSGRLFGISLSIVGDQYNQTSIIDLVSYYCGVNIGSIVPNLDYLILGRDLPEDRAYGTALGYLASMILLSSDNIILIIIQAFLIFTILSILESLIQDMFWLSSNVLVKLLVVVGGGYAVMQLNDGLSLTPVYLIIILLYIGRRVIKKHNYQRRAI